LKRFIASFVKGQVLLLAPQPVLLGLIFFERISLFYAGPVVISLSMLWGWFDYSGKAQRRGASVLKRLERLVDDFGQLNFQKTSGPDDERIVRLLDKAQFGGSASTTPELAAAATEKIKDIYFTLEMWYFSFRQKVRMSLRSAGTLIEYDLLELVNEFTEFYGEFIEKVAEGTLHLIRKGDMTSMETERETFSDFKTRLSELRGRANAFLQGLYDDGLPISETKVPALESDPWFDSAKDASSPQSVP
jgi:hypothetical protein